MFYWRGQHFHGLVDVAGDALYTDPEDDFAAAVGISNSLEGGQIEEVQV